MASDPLHPTQWSIQWLKMKTKIETEGKNVYDSQRVGL